MVVPFSTPRLLRAILALAFFMDRLRLPPPPHSFVSVISFIFFFFFFFLHSQTAAAKQARQGGWTEPGLSMVRFRYIAGLQRRLGSAERTASLARPPTPPARQKLRPAVSLSEQRMRANSLGNGCFGCVTFLRGKRFTRDGARLPVPEDETPFLVSSAYYRTCFY